MQKTLEQFTWVSNLLSEWFNWVACVSIVGMMALTVANAIGSKGFSQPVPAAIEVVSLMATVTAGFAIAQTQAMKGHIEVEFFTVRMPERVQYILGCLTSLLSLSLFSLLIWRCIQYGQSLHRAGEVSMTAEIPFYPFVYGIAAACIPLCLLLINEFLRSAIKAVTR
ncbi:MAG: TRAP transporter small permease [Dehalococcoidia bacterium]